MASAAKPHLPPRAGGGDRARRDGRFRRRSPRRRATRPASGRCSRSPCAISNRSSAPKAWSRRSGRPRSARRSPAASSPSTSRRATPVRAGQVLARIDARTADQAVAAGRSQIAEAEANLANAKRKYERSRDLVAQKFVSQAALDQAEAEYKAAQAQLAAITANAGQAIAAQSFTTVTAPYAGVVGATLAELGDMAQPGRPLVTVFDPRELRVTATRAAGGVARDSVRRADPRRDPGARQVADRGEGDRHPAGRCAHAHVAGPPRPPGDGRRAAGPVRAGAFRRRHGPRAGDPGVGAGPPRRGHRRLSWSTPTGGRSCARCAPAKRRATGRSRSCPACRQGERIAANAIQARAWRPAAVEMTRARDARAMSAARGSGISGPHRPLLPVVAADAAAGAACWCCAGAFAIVVTPREEEPQIDVDDGDGLRAVPRRVGGRRRAAGRDSGGAGALADPGTRARVVGVEPGAGDRSPSSTRSASTATTPWCGCTTRSCRTRTGCRRSSASASRWSSPRASTTCRSSR